MGGLVSRWRAKQSTVEVLEFMEKEIKLLEESREKDHRRRTLWVGRLLLYSSIIYLLACFIVYCWYFPEEWSARLLMALPCLTFPVIIWMLRLLLLIWFSRRTQRNNDALEEKKLMKKKILEEVMEKETYKTAKFILERFDPDSKKAKELEQPPTGPCATPRPGQELRQRTGVQRNPSTPASPVQGSPQVATPGLPKGISAPGGPPERGLQQVMQPNLLMRRTGSPTQGMGLHPPGPPLARPILPRERGALDRVVEYLVGDGPQNRYALICQQCFSHNGMALKEEFEYVAFRCAYCYFLNPARKTRPHAPRLQEVNFERPRLPESQPSFGSPPSRDSTDDADEEPASESAEELEELVDAERTSGASTPCTDQQCDKLAERDKEAVLPATADIPAVTSTADHNEESLMETD